MDRYNREIRDQLFDDLIMRTDEIEGSDIEGFHTPGQVKRWLMDLRNAYYDSAQDKH